MSEQSPSNSQATQESRRSLDGAGLQLLNAKLKDPEAFASGIGVEVRLGSKVVEREVIAKSESGGHYFVVPSGSADRVNNHNSGTHLVVPENVPAQDIRLTDKL